MEFLILKVNYPIELSTDFMLQNSGIMQAVMGIYLFIDWFIYLEENQTL